MSNTSITIPAETARHVLWHYGAAGGYQPGSYTQNLMRTIDAADRTHTEILRTAYPALVTAMDMAGNNLDGMKRLLVIATGEAPRCVCGVGPYTLDGRCETCTETAA